MNFYTPIDLLCENLVNPLGIDKRNPKFSWSLKHREPEQYQSAYRIIISKNIELIKKEIGDEWDSGKVISRDNTNIYYSGQPIKSITKYSWRVMWWDKNENQSPFSEIAFFETGYLNKNEWIAKWITKKDPVEFQSKGTMLAGQFMGEYIQVHAIYLRKEFSIKQHLKSARAYISGIGYYELRLNSIKIGDKVLDPAQTDYQKIALYSTYDITRYLNKNNAIGVILGNGRHIRYYGFDNPKLIMQISIEYANGEFELITTDESWKTSHGPLTENSIYNGEKYDARLEMPGWDEPDFADLNWEHAIIVSGPTLASQLMQPIRVTEHLKPKKMYSPVEGVFIFDFEQNYSGWVKLFVQGTTGTEIKIRFAENIFNDGTLNTLPNEKAEATDIYILKGTGLEYYEPRFTYHGFRYVEITGFPGVPTLENLIGCFVHSDVEKTGDFYCSNELINQIHKNIIWGQLSNLMSIPSDCSQRDERHGWMGDAHLSAEEAIYNFDMHAFYSKYLNDIKLSQKDDGSVPDVVPPYYRHLYPADPAWGAAYIIIAWYLYFYYGDLNILKEHYDSLKKYIEFLNSKSETNLVKSLGKYGDWCPPGSVPPKMTPPEFTSSWYYYHDTSLLSKIANILGKVEDEKRYSDLAEDIKKSFNKMYLKDDMYFSITTVATEKLPSQTSQVLPLFLDMVPNEKRQKILDKLLYCVINRCDYHIDTGIIGTRYLLDVLSQNGYDEVAYKVATQKSYPGWGYMISEGATTLWERWEKLTGGSMNSHNHIMFGSIDAWFYRIIAGVSCLEPGWKKILIKPPIIKDLVFAAASLKTFRRDFRISWRRGEDFFELVSIIPVGSQAEVNIPLLWENFSLTEGDVLLYDKDNLTKKSEGITYIGKNTKYIVFLIGSGLYHFSMKKININE
jgi:alpha-L-rhamnosidase